MERLAEGSVADCARAAARNLSASPRPAEVRSGPTARTLDSIAPRDAAIHGASIPVAASLRALTRRPARFGALLLCAAILGAVAHASPWHGGVYNPPGGDTGGGGDVTPPGAFPPPNAPSPAAPTAPAPASPSVPATATPPATGSVPTRGRTGPMPIATGGEMGVEPSSWQLWWRYNRDEYLDLKARVEALHPATGSDARSDSDERIARGLAAARETLSRETQRDLVSSLLVALARSADDGARAAGPELAQLITPFLANPDQEIGETAAAALGILGHPAAIPELAALLHDDEAGRKLAGGRVSARTRAFAAYALGISAARSEREEVQAFVAHHLQRELENSRGGATADLPAACVIALGLVPMSPDAESGSIRPRTKRAAASVPPRSRTAQAGALVRFLRDDQRPALARAHVPDALARLAADAGTELRAEIAGELVALLERGSRQDDGILRGAVLALGRLADCDADAADVKMRGALKRALEASDVQARLFAIVSLAQVACRPGSAEDPRAVQSEVQSLLLERLVRGRSRDRAWSALALGILERGRVTLRLDTSPAVRAALRRELADTSSPEQVGAIAIGLGLCGDRSSTKLLLAKLDDVRDPVGRGHVATALGLLGAPEAVAPLRAILAKARYQPELLRETAIALALSGDSGLEATLLAELRAAKSLASQAGIAQALGFSGTLATLEPLSRMLADKSLTTGARAFAAVALGMVCDRERTPWNAFLSAGVNYPSSPASLSDGTAGILDIL